MSTIQIEPADVIRLIAQYLKENNLSKTLQCLQDETSVSLNTVDSIETFVNDINSGNWDVVLRVVRMLQLPDSQLIDLYEQIAIELIELRETRAANWLIHKTEPMQKLEINSPDRYLNLRNLLAKPYFNHQDAYRDGANKESRRATIANALKKEVTVVPPQRLLSLISDALKWQKYEGLLPSGSTIDIFTGKATIVQVEEETHPNILHKHCIKPLRTISDNEIDDSDSTGIFVCCAEFSPDGHYILVGYSTGVVEVRNPSTGRLSNDLSYQAKKNYIITPSRSPVLSICFSASDMIAIGDKSGDISVWKLETGKLVQVFKSAHRGSVTCILFSSTGKEILSGGHDFTVKLHGMRSNKTIRDFRGHKSFVHALAFSRNDCSVVTGGSDSTVRIWDAQTAQLVHEHKCPSRVSSIIHMPHLKSDYFLVGTRSGCLQLIDLNGKLKSSISFISDKPEADDSNKSNDLADERESKNQDEAKAIATVTKNFYSFCISPKYNWIYAVDSSTIYCLEKATKEIKRKLVAHEEASNDLIGVRHHPLINLLATFDTQGNLKLWKP